MASDKILGIDLGTTNTCFGIIEGGEPTLLKNRKGNEVTRSVVAFQSDGEILVGEKAENQEVKNPDRTVRSIKRKMGREEYTVSIGVDDYTPEQISAFILSRVKEDAEQYVGEEIERAIITVPAYFTDRQRQATKRAGKIAGLEVERIINEPTAAAIAYGIDDNEDKTVLIFDLGGGTFDVSLLDMGQGVYDVVATNGDAKLGGDDWDQVLIDHFAEKFNEEHGIQLKDRPQARARLKEECRDTKERLSSSYDDTVQVPFITQTEDGALNLEYNITREHFNRLSASLVHSLEDPVEQVMEDGGVSETDIDDVILVGGATRMPMVREKVEEMFGMPPKNHVNPDKAVALGATIQAGLISGEAEDTVLLDVTPLTLGIEVQGGIFEPLIPRNSTIPTETSKIYTTSKDNQKSVHIRVFQGEEPIADRNEFLDEFVLTGLPKAEAGTPKIEVTFSIDLDGIVNVTAHELASGKKRNIEIKGGSGIAGEKIEEMRAEKREAERESKEQRRRRKIQTRAEEMVEHAETALQDENIDVSVRVANEIEEQKQVVEQILAKEDFNMANLETEMDRLEHNVGQVDMPLPQ
jgi:molecular chaperone DnaK